MYLKSLLSNFFLVPTCEEVRTFCFSLESIERILGRKVMTNLDSILKTRDITLPTKGPSSQTIVFPVFRYGCESGPQRRLSAKELMLLNCGVEEDS